MDYASVAEELVPSVTSERAETEVLRTARSDPAAFESLYQLYFPRIYAYCLRQLGHPEDAEDLTSFIFAQAIANLRSYWGGSVAAWLFRRRRRAPRPELDGRPWEADARRRARVRLAQDQLLALQFRLRGQRGQPDHPLPPPDGRHVRCQVEVDPSAASQPDALLLLGLGFFMLVIAGKKMGA